MNLLYQNLRIWVICASMIQGVFQKRLDHLAKSGFVFVVRDTRAFLYSLSM